MNQPLVSAIVTTKNNHATLEACLQSIKDQTYPNVEIVVVDNSSTDDTKDIARKFTDNVFNQGPERCAQRNYAAKVAQGDYIVIIDSDMELSKTVLADCVGQVRNPDIDAVTIPEESFGDGFWAQCKKLERSFYVGVSWIEAARFFSRDLFNKLGGYDETLVSGEDWDLSNRAAKLTQLGHIDALIYHNEGRINLRKTLKKKYYYAQHAKAYLKANPEESMLNAQAGPIQRYKLFFSKPTKLFRNPAHGLGMLFLKTSEFAAGAVGYMVSKG